MIEYTGKVCDNGDKYWYLNGELHRVIEGVKYKLVKRMDKSCSGKVVEIEGVKYKLVEVV